MYKLIQKLEMRNDAKTDLLISCIYLAQLLLSIGAAGFLFFFEPGAALGKVFENVVYIIKIGAIAALCFSALYALIKLISTLIIMLRRGRGRGVRA